MAGIDNGSCSILNRWTIRLQLIGGLGDGQVIDM